jgi:hypothetical protein
MLTVLRISSALVLTLIILANVCVRRRRPASARGLFVPGVPLENSSRAVYAIGLTRSRSTLSDWPSLYVWGLLQ